MPEGTKEIVSKVCNECYQHILKIDSSWIDFLPPIAVILAAFAAGFWAWYTVKRHEVITKKRCTMELVMERSRDRKFVAGFFLLRQLHDAVNIDIKLFTDTENEIDLEGIVGIDDEPMTCKSARILLSYLLNQLEYMATGILSEIYDEQILYNSSKTSTVNVYKKSKAYIEDLQDPSSKNKPNAYEHFVHLSESWSRDKLIFTPKKSKVKKFLSL